MKIIEKNEQIIGKTLVSHNKMLKDLEKAIAEAATTKQVAATASAAGAGNAAELQRLVDQNQKELSKLRGVVDETKYIVNQMNPVAYVTVDQVNDLIDEKIDRALELEERKRAAPVRRRRRPRDEYEEDY